ncbi:MAG: hypothetical protein LPK80_12510 [Bacteroidota bacterium]|nr:hypothetical protein [Bacteroidota bacterium]MDX5404276.1 hypothetical protein [Bacteroidota bacterium]MDX5427296.1 hypothetical protein [Bacteroidota bacterium]MDX5446950.1 hypothetical protein [Bacteroidota bacterium]MDX5505248.1 hypothetical protein [Bacteroidota bacterium]
MTDQSESILYKAIRHIKEMPTDEWKRLTMEFMDDQPYLNGFLINLSEEFGDEEHEALVRVAVMLHHAFKLADVPMRTIVQSTIDDVVRDKVREYEEMDEEDELGVDEMTRMSSSPRVFDDIRRFLKEELNNGIPRDLSEKQNLFLIVEVMIEAYELSAIIGDAYDKNQKENGN